uniref:Uncharacterized protein n=1 Tax=Magallana gigas TaxID=29159 RepID=K1Q5P6_MAGGI
MLEIQTWPDSVTGDFLQVYLRYRHSFFFPRKPFTERRMGIVKCCLRFSVRWSLPVVPVPLSVVEGGVSRFLHAL